MAGKTLGSFVSDFEKQDYYSNIGA